MEIQHEKNLRTIEVQRFDEGNGNELWEIIRMSKLQAGDVFKVWEGKIGSTLIGTFQASHDPIHYEDVIWSIAVEE